MDPTAANDLEWSRRTAGFVVDEFIYPKWLNKAAFPRAASIAASEIHSWLVRRDYPKSYGMIAGGDNVDRIWTQKVAQSIVGALLTAGFLAAANRDRAVAMAEEELWVHLIMEDRPPQKD